ncbi:MAG: alpha/beta hydrolase [Pseudomonadota bacterium]
MSVMRPMLNAWLRWTEKPHLRRASSIEKVRRSFEAKSKLFFHAPRGASFADDRLGGVPVHWAWALGVGREDGPVLLYVHGGAFVFGSPRTHRAMLVRLSAEAKAPACLVQYRLAPENVFPAAFDDCMAVYKSVMHRRGGVVLGGDSAGGALVLSLLAEITRAGLPQPLGTFAFSPLTDATFSGESVSLQAEAEVVLPAERAEEMTLAYLDGAEAKDPRVSPLYGAFSGAAPVWICAGDTEILLDDTRRMAAHLRAAGVDVTEIIEHDLPHVWPIFHNLLPEGRATLRDLGAWIRSLSSSTNGS